MKITRNLCESAISQFINEAVKAKNGINPVLRVEKASYKISRRANARLKAAQETLKTTPGDPEANTVVDMYQANVAAKRNWPAFTKSELDGDFKLSALIGGAQERNHNLGYPYHDKYEIGPELVSLQHKEGKKFLSDWRYESVKSGDPYFVNKVSTEAERNAAKKTEEPVSSVTSGDSPKLTGSAKAGLDAIISQFVKGKK